MAGHGRHRPMMRRTDVERAGQSVNTARRNDSGTVLVPVLSEHLVGDVGAFGDPWLPGNARGGGGVIRELEDEVVGGRRGAQVEDTNGRVCTDGGDNIRFVWREGGGVDAAVNGKSGYRSHMVMD